MSSDLAICPNPLPALLVVFVLFREGFSWEVTPKEAPRLAQQVRVNWPFYWANRKWARIGPCLSRWGTSDAQPCCIPCLGTDESAGSFQSPCSTCHHQCQDSRASLRLSDRIHLSPVWRNLLLFDGLLPMSQTVIPWSIQSTFGSSPVCKQHRRSKAVASSSHRIWIQAWLAFYLQTYAWIDGWFEWWTKF